MSETPEDLAMRARMAEEDAARFREALIEALGYTGCPSDDTIIAFATQAIAHSKRQAPDNPLGRHDPSEVRDTDEAVAILRATASELIEMRTDRGYRLARYIRDVEHLLPLGGDQAGGGVEGVVAPDGGL